MGSLVLVAGANVGGRTFRPRELPARLPELGLTNLGAAGTFVASGRASAERLRRAIAAELPFEAAVLVVPGDRVVRLARSDPLGPPPPGDGVRKFVTVSVADLDPAVPLPVVVPRTDRWEVRIELVDGPLSLGVRCRRGPRTAYPSAVVERVFGPTTTTRWWETFVAAADRLSA